MISSVTATASPASKVKVTPVEVIKSPQDKKQYRHLTLANGLTVLLIHDPEISLQKVFTEGEARGCRVHAWRLPKCILMLDAPLLK